MAVDNNQQNTEGTEGYKERRGNRVSRKAKSEIKNLPGVADDEVGIHFGSRIPMEGSLNTDTDAIPTEAVESLENSTDGKAEKPEAGKRTMTEVPFDAIRPADWGILNKAQKEAIEASVYGTSSLRELDILEESMENQLKNDPRFRTMLDEQRIYLIKEKAKRLGVDVKEGVDESSESEYNANEKDDITKKEIELAEQKLVEATNKLAKLEGLYAKKNAKRSEQADKLKLEEVRSNLGG